MSMKKKPVTGMKDILPKEMEIRNYVMQEIRENITQKSNLKQRMPQMTGNLYFAV